MEQKKIAHILCHTEQDTGQKIEIFPSEQWQTAGGKKGFYRVRIDRIWHCEDGEKYSFLSPEQLSELIISHLNLEMAKPEPKPAFRARQHISVKGPNGWTRGMIGSDPILGPDKRWRVWVRGYGFSKFYLCDKQEDKL
ncbi:hypothetical protein [Desulfovibrio gilichinskyi]|uniref:Uncharacterized protein n=1 Tax=Desulfovibrio gilichinskyi TaxID=1519643 RepID=A0A1X7F361_9BACT|nr:hypothetical protein [Desulfovibrio gilichinskyi]SMF44579.1 hypothetical protein SAMN06295933_3610 [Desulfovibrio gilichinskyi]